MPKNVEGCVSDDSATASDHGGMGTPECESDIDPDIDDAEGTEEQITVDKRSKTLAG